MSRLKDIIDFERIVDFLQQHAIGTIDVLCIINNSEELTVWKGDEWESVFGELKDCTIHINVWVCICEKKSFGYLMSIVHRTVIGSST
jgi:hypothetical protein